MTDWNNVPALVSGLREPTDLKRELRARIQEAYAELVAERGEVHVPEDTFAMQRRLGLERDRFAAYASAFTEVTKLLRTLMEEELVEAVGEQDGIPNQGLTIPSADGDIHLSLDTAKVYDIDMDQLLAVHTSQTLNTVDELDMLDNTRAPTKDEVAALVTTVIDATVGTVLSWGKFELQISKVRAYAATLARNGRDDASAVVTGAISESHPYRGVKFERKSP